MQNWIMQKISRKYTPNKTGKSKFNSENFFYEKGNYLKNGIGLTEALLLSESNEDKEIREKILSGMGLSEAMSSLNHFTRREISLIRLAEETGNLAGAFQAIHLSLKEQRELNSKIITVLIYPAVLLATAFIFLVAAVYFIVPPLYSMLSELGAENGLLKALNGVHLEIPMAYVLVTTMVIMYILSKGLRDRDNIFRLVLGRNMKSYKEMQFIEELSMLTRGGVDLMESFVILKEEGYECASLLDSIRNGTGFKEAFQTGGYSSVLIGYLTMAEETGNYNEALESFVSLQKFRFKDQIQKKTALIEPAAILLMGLLVFIVSYIIMIPMLDAYENL